MPNIIIIFCLEFLTPFFAEFILLCRLLAVYSFHTTPLWLFVTILCSLSCLKIARVINFLVFMGSYATQTKQLKNPLSLGQWSRLCPKLEWVLQTIDNASVILYVCWLRTYSPYTGSLHSFFSDNWIFVKCWVVVHGMTEVIQPSVRRLWLYFIFFINCCVDSFGFIQDQNTFLDRGIQLRHSRLLECRPSNRHIPRYLFRTDRVLSRVFQRLCPDNRSRTCNTLGCRVSMVRRFRSHGSICGRTGRVIHQCWDDDNCHRVS